MQHPREEASLAPANPAQLLRNCTTGAPDQTAGSPNPPHSSTRAGNKLNQMFKHPGPVSIARISSVLKWAMHVGFLVPAFCAHF